MLHYLVGSALTIAYVLLVVGMARQGMKRRREQEAWRRHVGAIRAVHHPACNSRCRGDRHHLEGSR